MKSILQRYQNIIGANSDLFMEVRSSYAHTKFPHRHDFYEFCLVYSGKQLFTINNHPLEATEGSLVFIRPKDIHSKKYLETGEHITIAFREELFDALFTYIGHEFSKEILLEPEISPVVHFSKIEKDTFIDQIKKLHSSDMYNKQKVNVQLKILLIHIFTKYFMEVHLNENKIPEWLEEVLLEMKKDKNFIEGLPAFLRLSGICHEHLCRVIKKYLNTTPTQFINDQRLDYSSKLLLFTNLDITQICYESGFGNISHFYNHFKKRYGISPAKYRKMNQINLTF